jgi:RNA polymerase sigma factor (sigma-70 family)
MRFLNTKKIGNPMLRETIVNNRTRDEALLHLDALWQTTLWFVDNDHDAEEVVINAYLKASKIWDSPISKEARKTQMFMILMKTLFVKTRLNFREHLSDYFENKSDSFLSDELLEVEMIPKEEIIEAIKRLPVEIRLVMILSIFEKFSYQEIAEIIGVHKKAVRLNVYQGYLRLRRDLINSLAVSGSKLAIG